MAGRTVETHAGFFLPELTPGMSVLDCGCGPGTITVGLAQAVSPGEVHGVDISGDQLDLGRKLALDRGLEVAFHEASAYELPFESNRFDAVFAHAILEHLSDPIAALREMLRVLHPGGVVGASSPDWGGFIVTPPSDILDGTLNEYNALMRANGGNALAGRHLGEWLHAAGLNEVALSAFYECYTDPVRIAGLLVEQLDNAGRVDAAEALRSWTSEPRVMFAQAWVTALGRAPSNEPDERDRVKRERGSSCY